MCNALVHKITASTEPFEKLVFKTSCFASMDIVIKWSFFTVSKIF